MHVERLHTEILLLTTIPGVNDLSSYIIGMRGDPCRRRFLA